MHYSRSSVFPQRRRRSDSRGVEFKPTSQENNNIGQHADLSPRGETKICALELSVATVKGLGGRDVARTEQSQSQWEAVRRWSAADLCGGISQLHSIGSG